MKNWFINLKVKNKLSYTFVLVIGLIVTIGAVGIYNMWIIHGYANKISSVRMPGIDLLLQIDRDMQQALVAQRTMIFTDVASPKFQELKKEYADNITQAGERWDDFRKIEDAGFDPALLSKYESSMKEWRKFSEEIISSREQDTPDGRSFAIELSFREGSSSFEAARDVIDKLTQVSEDMSAAEIEESSNSYSSAFVLFLTGIGVILFVSIFSAVVISKTLGNPLVNAAGMMNELRLGHIGSRINYKSKDEIGILTGSMDEFADTLQEFTSKMHAIADGNLNTEVKLLDKDDEISPALNKIAYTLKELKNESDTLISNAVAGNLSKRGNAQKFNGGYKEIVKGFNDTLDAVIGPITEGSKVLQTMATGDLTVRVSGDYKGDHQIIKNSINELGDSLTQLISEVVEAVQATASASNQISSSAEEMAAGSQEQSAQTTEVAGAVEQMTSTILETSKNSSIASENAKYSMKIANEGGNVVAATVEGMKRISEVVSEAANTVKELGKSSDQIGEIVQVIDDIADQTNLLALNAAIEAARAGEQGRGFAVVADEVRKLAERTTKATKEIAVMIKQIQKDTTGAVVSMQAGTDEVQKGRDLAVKAGDSLKEIIKGALQTVDIVNQVAAASEEQSTAAEQISKNIVAISSVTSESASGVQQIARAAEDLSRLTNNLQNLINRFRINGNTSTLKSLSKSSFLAN